VDALSGFLVGLVGSLHCVGMCGPIALALPIGSAGMHFIAGRVFYNAGRIITYITLGGVLGSFGSIFVLAGMQQTLSVVVGCVMLFGVLLPSVLRGLSSHWPVARIFHSFLRATLRRLLEQKTLRTLFLIGIVNGFLPCGFLYIALAGAATLGDVTRGMVFMGGFGLGTTPTMLGVGLLGRPIQAGVRKRVVRILPVFTVILAMLFILRGMNLGIPYISPHVKAAPIATDSAFCHGD